MTVPIGPPWTYAQDEQTLGRDLFSLLRGIRGSFPEINPQAISRRVSSHLLGVKVGKGHPGQKERARRCGWMRDLIER